MPKRSIDLSELVDDYDDAVQFHMGIWKKAKHNLIEEGIFPAQQPLNSKGDPIRPSIPAGQISKMSPAEVIDLLSEVAAYAEYLCGQAAHKNAIAKAHSEALADIVSQIRLRTRGSPAHVSDVIKTDPRYLEARPKALEKEYEAEYLKAILDGLEKAYAVASRAIAFHDIERNSVRRENNVSGGNRGGSRKFKDTSMAEFKRKDE